MKLRRSMSSAFLAEEVDLNVRVLPLLEDEDDDDDDDDDFTIPDAADTSCLVSSFTFSTKMENCAKTRSKKAS